MRACRGRRLNNLSSRYKMSAPTSEGLRLFIEQGMIKSGAVGDGGAQTTHADGVLSIF